MKSILKSTTFWLAILAILANVLESIQPFAADLGIGQTGMNVIAFVLFILNRLNSKGTPVYLFKAPKNAEAAK